MLQPISIVTETQFRRDQAGVTGDLEVVHPSKATILKQVIQSTGARADAKIRRLIKQKAAEEAEGAEGAIFVPSKQPSSSSTSDDSSSEDVEGVTMEDVESIETPRPSIIVIPIPQATDTLEAPTTEAEVCLLLHFFIDLFFFIPNTGSNFHPFCWI